MMPEYIDASINPADFIEVWETTDAEHGKQLVMAVDDLKCLPTADVRPVIFCRDCKHRGWIQEPCHGKSIDYCRALEHPVDRLFFCGMGERKDSDG